MTDKEFEIFINEQDFIGHDFIDESFKFWFNNNDHIRTPFPENIQRKLKERTIRIFMEWVYELGDEEKNRLTNDIIVETFEMILFNQAMNMVTDEDHKISICYPFLPRLGDVVNDKNKGTSTIISRELDVKDDEKKYLKVRLINTDAELEWATEFELPA
ncbi:hypothetical protein [Draconibacterium sp.]|uniref:hypothetical protein n=1 Tax=Draconibacterium sp. TaxID=1965318 RepID=UPI003569FF7F